MKPYELYITNTARSDLKQIHDFIAEENQEAAARLLQELVNKLFELAKNRVDGVSREWVSEGLRAFPYKNRCFYYRIKNNAMLVIRILHQRQDISGKKFPE